MPEETKRETKCENESMISEYEEIAARLDRLDEKVEVCPCGSCAADRPKSRKRHRYSLRYCCGTDIDAADFHYGRLFFVFRVHRYNINSESNHV